MKTKHILFTIALFFSVTCINAQDKYEFMIISYYPGSNLATIAVDGKENKNVKLEGENLDKSSGNSLLKIISEKQDEKWEIITFTDVAIGTLGAHVTYVYLKRKK